MPVNHLTRAALLMLCIVTASVAVWEIYLRKKGLTPTFDDGGPLWADKRSQVYQPADKATVFIGSSRIKFDLDIPTWEAVTGNTAVQLACVGSNPLPVLDNLAADTKFKGRIVVDVTEGLFFSTAMSNMATPNECIKYYNERTPAQQASFVINHFLESKLVFLDKENFSLNARLNQLELKSRPGVFMFPIFPWQFGRVNYNRQETMVPQFVSDTNLHNQVTGIWQFFRKMSKEPPASGPKLDSILNTVKADVAAIKARGGDVFFIRTPSSGPFWMGEQMGFPRPKYWDRLLLETQCAGLHFADYPAINHFICPEWSHLAPADAILFTKEFIRILQTEKGWTFNKPAAN